MTAPRPRLDLPRPTADPLAGLGLDALVDALAERVAERVAAKLGARLDARSDGELLTIEQAAALTKLLPSWLKAKARTGALRSRKCGRYRRFVRDELLDDVRRLTEASE